MLGTGEGEGEAGVQGRNEENVKFKFLAREGGEGSKALIEERGTVEKSSRGCTMMKWTRLGRGEENRRRNEWKWKKWKRGGGKG